MIISSPNEIAFSLYGFPVYWYGIVMGLAVMTGILCAEKIRGNIPKNFFIDNSPWMIIFGVLGARLYYCLLNFGYYFKYPSEILNIRQGGLSVHGMIFAGILLMFLLAKKYKIKILELLDVCACSSVLAQSIGRWGNFFNSEAFGIPTNGSWGLFIPPQNRPSAFLGYEFFHPTFLYESLLDFVIFLILLKVIKLKKVDGTAFCLYLILYSSARFFIESIRLDSALNISGIPVAQIISVALFACGVFGLVKLYKKA